MKSSTYYFFIDETGHVFTILFSIKYTYSILPVLNCPLSLGNGQLSKLHVNKAHFISMCKRKRSMSIDIHYILVEVYFKSEKILVSVHS